MKQLIYSKVEMYRMLTLALYIITYDNLALGPLKYTQKLQVAQSIGDLPLTGGTDDLTYKAIQVWFILSGLRGKTPGQFLGS